MTHTPTPWRVYTNKDGTKLVGIGAADGGGILDAGFGVWSWNDPEGIANAHMVVKAVNNHAPLVKALQDILDKHGGLGVSPEVVRARALLNDFIAPRD